MDATDTTKSRISTARAMILDHDLAAVLNSWNLSHLKDSDSDYISVDFHNSEARSGFTLYVDTKFVCTDVADNGDVYRTDRIDVRMSWSSLGSAGADVCKARLEFLARGVDLTAKVNDRVGGEVRILHKTAAEVIAAKEAADRAEAQRLINGRIESAIRAVSKAMRVNGNRDVPKALLVDVPNGVTTHVFDGKTYELRVRPANAIVERRA